MKQKYRDCFAKCDFIRWSTVVKEAGYTYCNFSSFMSGDDSKMSIRALKAIYDTMLDMISRDIKIV